MVQEGISAVFERSLKLLEELSSVRVEQGEFFLTDGTLVEGQIVHIGQIASFGTSRDRGGTLTPVGDGRLKLARGDSRQVAYRLSQGENPPVLPIFLYESLYKSVETTAKKTLRDTLEGGGMIGVGRRLPRKLFQPLLSAV